MNTRCNTLALSCFAVLFIGFGIVFSVVLQGVYANHLEAQGTVIASSFCGTRPKDGVKEYDITYQFETQDGTIVTGNSDVCYAEVPPIGSTDTILYDPDDPSVVANANSLAIFVTLGYCMIAAGSLALTGIIVAFWFSRGREQEAKQQQPGFTKQELDPKV